MAAEQYRRRVRGRHIAGVFVAGIVGAYALTLTSPAHLSKNVVPTPTEVATPSATLSPTSLPTFTPNPVTATGKCHARYLSSSDSEAVLPDPNCTPGALNSDVTQANIGLNICNHNWSTKSIRPPVSYTTPLKVSQIKEYGYLDTSTKSYEEDHLISLELGGNPTSPANLWPEPQRSQPNEKDSVENYLHKQVCSGAISLAQAQQEISTNWYQVYLSMPK